MTYKIYAYITMTFHRHHGLYIENSFIENFHRKTDVSAVDGNCCNKNALNYRTWLYCPSGCFIASCGRNSHYRFDSGLEDIRTHSSIASLMIFFPSRLPYFWCRRSDTFSRLIRLYWFSDDFTLPKPLLNSLEAINSI